MSILQNVGVNVSRKMLLEEYYLLGYNALQSSRSSPMAQRNILPASSRLQSKLSKKLPRSRLQADPVPRVSKHLPDYTVSHTRR
jgi:hypothetical protein